MIVNDAARKIQHQNANNWNNRILGFLFETNESFRRIHRIMNHHISIGVKIQVLTIQQTIGNIWVGPRKTISDSRSQGYKVFQFLRDAKK